MQTNYVVVVINTLQLTEVLSKLEQKGYLWASGDKPTKWTFLWNEDVYYIEVGVWKQYEPNTITYATKEQVTETYQEVEEWNPRLLTFKDWYNENH